MLPLTCTIFKIARFDRFLNTFQNIVNVKYKDGGRVGEGSGGYTRI